MPSPAPRSVTLPEPALAALLAERAAFHRFLARHLGNDQDADDVLHDSLLRALQRGDSLHRGERVVSWFYRLLRRAIADHFRKKYADLRRLERAHRETTAATPPDLDWDTSLCRCLAALVGTLPPRQAALVRRIDLNGELRPLVAHELGLSPGAFDVALHRARLALRRRLETFCGACTAESCLHCACPTPGNTVAS